LQNVGTSRRSHEIAPLNDRYGSIVRLNRPSLYAAFGNKEQLFRKALDRYKTGHAAFLTEALRKPTARAVAEQSSPGSSGYSATATKHAGA
jgi:AcrR family transcriptional regulator